MVPTLAGIGLAVELALTVRNSPHLVGSSTGFTVDIVMVLIYRRTRPAVCSRIGRR
ncbi:hypothetical protein ABZ614_33645 [Streptomyces sp. NPDC013178]|uniref:hypothetical protein n=1 Tax=Streptomyces sp. NPDC013178 TaxID=3155118 RepID=UPI0033F602F8